MASEMTSNEEFSYELKIPKERVAVLIGKQGETKKEIETAGDINLEIDSKEGDVVISSKDPIKLYTIKEVVTAIGRGFNPEIAMLLLKQDYGFEIISIADYAKSKADHQRLRGRVIGEEGKSRKIIEELTETYICVYGKTVGIIGLFDNLAMARRAVESLLSGSPHHTVYKWLEKRRKELRKRELAA